MLGLLDLTGSPELDMESHLMPLQCATASHGVLPGFGCSPAMVLPLSRVETDCSALKGN